MSVSLLSDLEDMFLKRHGRQLVELEEKNRNLQAACDNLRKKLFLEENKAHTLASRLGFSDYETMDHAISSMPSVWNARTIEASRHETAALRSDRDKQIVALQNIQEMHSLSLMEITSLKDERDRLLEENKQLHSGIATANTKLLSETSSGSAAGIFTGLSGSTLGLRQNTAPSSVEDIPNSRDRAKDPTSNALTDYQQPINDDDGCTVEHLKSRLSVLNHKYDALLAAKTLAAKKYMEDYTKWKEFKLWWYENSRKTRKKKRASGHHTHSRTSVARPTVKHVTITSSDAIDRSEDASHVTTSETHTGEGKDHFLDTTVLEHPGMGSGRQTTSTPESKTTTSVQGNLTPLSKERKR
ncbi:hypothetical protein BD410DRAFT_835597 [Rickenella mellea]|uniref:Uncharacterized protein n=1 Tax=Rickenella mellea TaxID=50990 RepID=A0A4Y7QKD9_9AGAM|nr:hypothetical protein BD410DRAFT_835597 [Rickenella mellea]